MWVQTLRHLLVKIDPPTNAADPVYLNYNGFTSKSPLNRAVQDLATSERSRRTNFFRFLQSKNIKVPIHVFELSGTREPIFDDFGFRRSDSLQAEEVLLCSLDRGLNSAPGGFFHQPLPPAEAVPVSFLVGPLRRTASASNLSYSSNNYSLDRNNRVQSLPSIPLALRPNAPHPLLHSSADVRATISVIDQTDEDLEEERTFVDSQPRGDVGPRIADGAFESVKRQQRVLSIYQGRTSSSWSSSSSSPPASSLLGPPTHSLSPSFVNRYTLALYPFTPEDGRLVKHPNHLSVPSLSAGTSTLLLSELPSSGPFFLPIPNPSARPFTHHTSYLFNHTDLFRSPDQDIQKQPELPLSPVSPLLPSLLSPLFCCCSYYHHADLFPYHTSTLSAVPPHSAIVGSRLSDLLHLRASPPTSSLPHLFAFSFLPPVPFFGTYVDSCPLDCVLL